jgi:hypothetical protein
MLQENFFPNKYQINSQNLAVLFFVVQGKYSFVLRWAGGQFPPLF